MKKATLYVKGMHCPSCEILMRDKFSEQSNIKAVHPNFNKQTVEVKYTGHLDREILNKKISEYGYRIVDSKAEITQNDEPFLKRVSDIGVIAVILFILYFFAQELKLIPTLNISGNISLVTVFLLGLVASTSTCMATSGALFLATVGRQQTNNQSPASPAKRGEPITNNQLPNANLISAFLFNAGRVVSYATFGLILGYFGKAISYNLQLGSILTLVISALMVLVGLNMAKLLPTHISFVQSFTGKLFEKLEKPLLRHRKRSAFLLGAITYLLPCGFTQTVQLYALGLADPVKSSLIMAVFALGTMPVLMSIGFATTLTKTSWYPYVQKAIGVIVLVVGISYFNNFLSLRGISLFQADSTSGITNVVINSKGEQEARMNVNGTGYSPSNFVIKKDVPVKWILNGENVFGCQGYLVVPSLGIQKVLEKGENTIEFTPTEVGTMNFSCGMGMYRGQFTVI